MKKRTLLLTLAILALLAVPAVAMALNATPRAVELPTGDGGWMDEMHGLMGDEGAFSDGGWMDEMHGLMGDVGAFSDGGWMDEMHGLMGDEGAFPDGGWMEVPSRMGMAPSQ